MADREKVKKGLDLCLTGEPSTCKDCPYDAECKEARGIGPSPLRRDALELLKQEEEVPVKRCLVHPNARYPFSCGNCGSYLMPTWIACPMCGRKVKWDG